MIAVLLIAMATMVVCLAESVVRASLGPCLAERTAQVVKEMEGTGLDLDDSDASDSVPPSPPKTPVAQIATSCEVPLPPIRIPNLPGLREVDVSLNLRCVFCDDPMFSLLHEDLNDDVNYIPPPDSDDEEEDVEWVPEDPESPPADPLWERKGARLRRTGCASPISPISLDSEDSGGSELSL